MATKLNKDTKLNLKIPKFFEADDRQEIADRVIDFIKARTLKGHNQHHNNWSGKADRYTEEYKKRTGKSEPVNLELTAAMLEAMKYFKGKNKAGEITVGYRKGSKQERKAEGNILGTYGQQKPIRGKSRPFLNILNRDLKDIVDDYIQEAGEEVVAGEREVPQKPKKPKKVPQKPKKVPKLTFKTNIF